MTSPSLPSSPTHKPRHVGPHESTDLASQVRDHFEGRIPEGAHPSAFLKPSEVSLLERARAEPLGVSKLADPVHRAGIVLRALSDG